MKLERGFGLLNEIEARTNVWNAAGGLRVPTQFSKDLTWIEFLMPEANRPPLEEWALLLGEAIHHARSALDAAAWAIATINGAVPRVPRDVSFPIAEDEEKWTSARRRLAPYIPAVFLERIGDVQPWRLSLEPGKINWLSALSELDNQDKHRGTLVATPSFRGFEVDGMLLGWADPKGEARIQLEVMPGAIGVDTPAGTPLGRIGFGEAFSESSLPPARGSLLLAPAALTESGVALPISELRDGLMVYVHSVIDSLTPGKRGQFELSQT